jgi:hypothetical protein
MIGFFTDPYPDELLYSACARYHRRVRNISKEAPRATYSALDIRRSSLTYPLGSITSLPSFRLRPILSRN